MISGPKAPAPRPGAVFAVATLAAIAGAALASTLLGGRSALDPVGLVLALVISAVAGSLWLRWNDAHRARPAGLARFATSHPVLLFWSVADAGLLIWAARTGSVQLERVSPLWDGVALYVALRAATLALWATFVARRTPAGRRIAGGLLAVAAALPAMLWQEVGAWRNAATGGALALVALSALLGSRRASALAPALAVALPALALAGASWIYPGAPLPAASPISSSSMLIALGVAAIAFAHSRHQDDLAVAAADVRRS